MAVVPWKKGKLVVPLEASPWPRGRAERMSVGSYGIGGSNVHVSLELLSQTPEI